MIWRLWIEDLLNAINTPRDTLYTNMFTDFLLEIWSCGEFIQFMAGKACRSAWQHRFHITCLKRHLQAMHRSRTFCN